MKSNCLWNEHCLWPRFIFAWNFPRLSPPPASTSPTMCSVSTIPDLWGKEQSTPTMSSLWVMALTDNETFSPLPFYRDSILSACRIRNCAVNTDMQWSPGGKCQCQVWPIIHSTTRGRDSAENPPSIFQWNLHTVLESWFFLVTAAFTWKIISLNLKLNVLYNLDSTHCASISQQANLL